VNGRNRRKAGNPTVKDVNTSFVGVSAPVVTGTSFIFIADPY
jgi:hypothetical protein